MATDEFLTVDEVATLLKVNQQTIRNWIESGIPDSIHYLDSGVMPIDGREPPRVAAVRVSEFA